MLRRRTTVAALILVAFSAALCDSREDEVDLENQRAIYLVAQRLLDPALSDFYGQCLNAVQAGQDCASTAGSAALYRDGFLLAVSGLSLSGSNAAICSVYSQSGALSALSPGVRVCYFRCETSYWQDARNNGRCSAASYEATSTAAEASLTTCTRTCSNSSTALP